MVLVSKLKDATAEKRQGKEQQSTGTSAFGQIFKEACANRKEELKQPQITRCYTCGYTKRAQLFVYQVESKEYC